MSHLSSPMSLQLSVINHRLCVINHQSPVTSHQHQSTIISDQSPVIIIHQHQSSWSITIQQVHQPTSNSKENHANAFDSGPRWSFKNNFFTNGIAVGDLSTEIVPHWSQHDFRAVTFSWFWEWVAGGVGWRVSPDPPPSGGHHVNPLWGCGWQYYESLLSFCWRTEAPCQRIPHQADKWLRSPGPSFTSS